MCVCGCLYVTSIDGGYRRSCFVMNSGKVVRYLACIACERMARFGNQSALCEKVMSSPMVRKSIT